MKQQKDEVMVKNKPKAELIRKTQALILKKTGKDLIEIEAIEFIHLYGSMAREVAALYINDTNELDEKHLPVEFCMSLLLIPKPGDPDYEEYCLESWDGYLEAIGEEEERRHEQLEWYQ